MEAISEGNEAWSEAPAIAGGCCCCCMHPLTDRGLEPDNIPHREMASFSFIHFLSVFISSLSLSLQE
jgi:hypothetical protein